MARTLLGCRRVGSKGDKRLYFGVAGVVFNIFANKLILGKVEHSMASMIREMPLENGLFVRFFDHTCLYYGDFHLVKIEIICEVPLRSDYFDEQTDLKEVSRLIGDPAVYRRTVEQMGVPSTAIATVVEQLVGNFVSHSLPYFAASGFPGRFLRTELARARKKCILPSRITAYHHD